jgi:hypothetical protein
MALPSVFTQEVADQLIARINRLTPDSKPAWGKMGVAEMLAHCNVTYELVYEEDKHPKPNFLVRLLLKLFVKKTVTNEVPYKRSSQTAPVFLIKDSRDFEKEKARLIRHIRQTQEHGAAHFDQKASHSFGKLGSEEWNNMFYKHLEHHLTQFGV